MPATRAHDDAMVEIIREDPLFADEYIAESLRSIDEPGGLEALFTALRQVARVQGLDLVAERSGVQRENLELALSAADSPLLRTTRAFCDGCGASISGNQDGLSGICAGFTGIIGAAGAEHAGAERVYGIFRPFAPGRPPGKSSGILAVGCTLGLLLAI